VVRLIILFGSLDEFLTLGQNATPYGDVWEWNQSTWTMKP
jgi:hypothetical protein